MPTTLIASIPLNGDPAGLSDNGPSISVFSSDQGTVLLLRERSYEACLGTASREQVEALIGALQASVGLPVTKPFGRKAGGK